jgi:mono/diheme cytochrome c family protein
MRYGVNPKYAQMRNPLRPTQTNVEAGRRLYSQNCAACHGERGYGDGPAGRNLNPPPANLVGIGRMPMVGDGYLYWTIADGGQPLGTAMPAYKDTLKRSDIWKIVLFLRGS